MTLVLPTSPSRRQKTPLEVRIQQHFIDNSNKARLYYFKAKRRALTNLWPLIVYFNYLEVSGILRKLVRVNRVSNMEPLNVSCQTSKTVLTFKANV